MDEEVQENQKNQEGLVEQDVCGNVRKFVLIQPDKDGIKFTQIIDRKMIESATVQFYEDATREQIVETINEFRMFGRKALGL